MGLEVFYDRKNDVVSVYFNQEEETTLSAADNASSSISKKDYEVDEAANLILDMIDLTDNKGSLKGFRVFNASRHYDSTLLDCAEVEELSSDEIRRRPSEKVIAKFGSGKI